MKDWKADKYDSDFYCNGDITMYECNVTECVTIHDKVEDNAVILTRAEALDLADAIKKHFEGEM